MAWFFYVCKEHGKFTVSLHKRSRSMPCPKCNSICYPILNGGTSRVVEVLDNGLMPRKVERLHNINEIMEERAKKNSKTLKDDNEA